MNINDIGAPLINVHDNITNINIINESETDINNLITIKHNLINLINKDEIKIDEENMKKINNIKNDYKKLIEEYK